MKKHKTVLSVATIGVVILIVVLMPKKGEPKEVPMPRANTRYIPAPTPTPVDTAEFFDPTAEIPEAILPRDLQ